MNTLYTLTLKRSAEHGGGTPMEQDFVMQFYTQPRNHLSELAVFPYEGAQVHYTKPTVELRVDSLLDTYNLFQKLRVLDSEGNELAWNKRSIKYNKRGDNYGFIRVPLTKDIEPGKDYQLILDADIADTAGIHLPAARVINFTGVNAGAAKPDMTMFEDFDYENYYLGLFLSQVRAESHFSSGLIGNAIVIDYQFSSMDGETGLCYNPDWGLEDDDWERPFVLGDKLGMHVWGDMSYNDLMVVFINYKPYSPSVAIPVCKIDFHGWRYVEIDLRNLESGVDYYLKEITLKPGSELMGMTGTLKLDNIIRGKSSSINEVPIAGLNVKCDGDYIVASADTYIQGVELLDINGRMIKANGGNCINVSSVEPGVYLVRVYINGQTTTRKVVIQ